MGEQRVVKRRGKGCLETAGITFFALLLGAFAASTLVRHAGGGLGERDAETDQLGAEPRSTASPVARARIRIEVRNGSGVKGAAEETTSHLRREGFDVVDFGNADRFDHERTIVIDRSGNRAFAREVATSLQGVPIESDPDSTLYLDVTVLIGRDLPQVLAGAVRPRRRDWRRWIDRIQWPWE